VYDNPTLYELEYADSSMNEDIPYWLGILEEYRPKRVLELACGTGRLTIPLARRGRSLCPDFRIVGVDLSEPFLRRAQERAAGLGPDVADAISFVLGDMVDIDLDEQFDLVFVGLNSFMLISDLQEQVACLKSIRRHLRPNGYFGLEAVVPPTPFLSQALRKPTAIMLDYDFCLPEHGIKRLLRFSVDRYDAMTQTDRTTFLYEIFYEDGRHERHVKDHAFHMYFPRELELLMLYAGFEILARYGNYDRTPFHSRAHQYLWIMRAARTSD
jgi:SAM-dependent methyltransferase